MTIITPPLFQTVSGTYDGADLSRPYRDFICEGVVTATDLEVSERGAGANMSVDVSAGSAWVLGDSSDLQPLYRCHNDGTVNLAVSAADGSNPRIDLVVAEVRDSAFSGVSQDWRLRVVEGTPAGSPSAPATPDSALALAQISIPAADTTISDAQITDVRELARIANGDPPAARVTRGTAQTIGNGGFAAMSWSSANYDDDEMWSAGAPTRLTAPRDGRYNIGGAVTWSSNASGTRAVQLRVNGSVVLCAIDTPAISGAMSMAIFDQYELSAGDYVELYVYQSSGGNLDVAANYPPSLKLSAMSGNRLG